MSTTTTNFGFTKPDLTDPADIAVLNTNLDLIDTQIKTASDSGGDIVVGDDGSVVDSNPETFDGHTSGEFVLKSGATMNGSLVAQNNSNYAMFQVRNIYLSTAKLSDSVGGDGDICLVYIP